jgi:hypothetical protein
VQPDFGSSSELEHAVHLGGAKSGLAHAVQLGGASPFRHLVHVEAGSNNGLEHLLEHLCLYVLLTTPGISVHHSVLFFGSENQPAGQLLFVLSVVSADKQQFPVSFGSEQSKMPFAGFGLHPNPKVEYGGVVQEAIFSSPTKSLN